MEEHSGAARARLRDSLVRRGPPVAPPLLSSEVAVVIRQRMRQGQVRLDEARALLAQFLAIPIRLRAPETLSDRAVVLAGQHNLPAVYDAHYVALAELLGRRSGWPIALRPLDRRPLSLTAGVVQPAGWG